MLTTYIKRFPRKDFTSSANINPSGSTTTKRQLTVHLVMFKTDVAVFRSVRCIVKELKDMLKMYLSEPLDIYDSEDCSGPVLPNDRRLGVRVQKVWAVLEGTGPCSDGITSPQKPAGVL